ncbi:hypothetical protein ACC698_38595, partial [Rhizobium johnstonii]
MAVASHLISRMPAVASILASVAIIMLFRKTPNSYSAWTTMTAPVLALLGIIGSLVLVSSNLSLLSGSE